MRRNALGPLSNNTPLPPQRSAMQNSRLGAAASSSTVKRPPIGGAYASSRPGAMAMHMDSRRNSMMPLPPARRSTMSMSTTAGVPAAGGFVTGTPATRYSTALTPRTGGGGGGGRNGDPRPLTDRGQLQQVARELVTFIVERGYNENGVEVSAKKLSTPSSKEFTAVFLFLVQRIDVHFQFLKRFEEEIPTLLKHLSYPFTISKTTLSACGSPHSWPALVTVLWWLMGCLRLNEITAQREMSMQQDDAKSRRFAFFIDNLHKAYRSWLKDGEVAHEVEIEHDEYFANESAGRKEEIVKLSKVVQDLQARDEAYANHASPLSISTDQLNTIQGNVSKFKQLIPSLIDHLDGVEARISTTQESLDKENKKIEAQTERKAQLEPVLAMQEDEAIDAERIVADREKLNEELQRYGTEREESEREQKKVQTRLALKLERLHSKVNEHHRALETYMMHSRKEKKKQRQQGTAGDDDDNDDVALNETDVGDDDGDDGDDGDDVDENENEKNEEFIDVGIGDARWKAGLTLEISNDASVSDLSQLLSCDVEGTILPAIEKIDMEIGRETPRLNDLVFRLHENVDMLEEKDWVLKHDVNILMGTKTQREAEQKAKISEFQKYLDERSESIVHREEERDRLLQQGRTEMEEMQRMVQKTLKLKDEMIQNVAMNRKKAGQSLIELAIESREHEEMFRTETQAFIKYTKESVLEFNALGNE